MSKDLCVPNAARPRIVTNNSSLVAIETDNGMNKIMSAKIGTSTILTNISPINRLFTLAIEERLDAAKYRTHRRSFRMFYTLLILPELLDESSLFLRDGLWDVHVKRDDLITHGPALHSLHSLAPQTHFRIALGTCRYFHVHRTTKRGHRHRAAEDGCGHGYGDAAVHIIASAVKERVRLHLLLIYTTRSHVHVNIEVAVARAVAALVTLAHQAYRITRVNSRGNLHCQGGAAAHLQVTSRPKRYSSTSMTLGARVRINMSRTAALRA